MATLVRDIDPLASVVCDAHNAIKAQIGAGSSFHLDKSERVLSFTTLSGTGAANEALAIAATNELMGVYLFHIADVLAHKEAGVAPALVKATDLATAYTLATAIKADYGTHIADTDLHYNADSTNTVAAADATTLSSLQTLVNEMKNTTALAAHMLSAPAAASLRLISL